MAYNKLQIIVGIKPICVTKGDKSELVSEGAGNGARVWIFL